MTTDKANLSAGPHENDTRHREFAVRKNEESLLNRENMAAAREDAAHLREDAAHLREEHASTREFDLKVAETLQAAADEHLLKLREANERLTIATVNAQILAENLQKTQVQLEKAKLTAEAANLAKSDFLSSMSHELRTPLNAILGFAQLLGTGTPQPTPAQNQRIEEILKAGWYLLELINEILDLAVIESGKIKLAQEAVSLTEVMRECQSMNEPQAQKSGIRVNYLPFDRNWVLSADHTRVKQVVNNLLTNAIKYNRANGTVDVACTSVTPQLIRISVTDTGEGLSPENLAQLFEPFNRLGRKSDREEGTGIGLAVTKHLVELMGGSIGVKSSVGVGSEFWVELIRDVTPQAAPGQATAADTVPEIPEDSALRTLLYVEDNPANLLLVEQIIERYPHIHMLSARDGNEGIALARTHLPDVILMDINLPGINGVEALHILREDPATAQIPVVALSANAMLRDIEKGMGAGFFRYLTKPIKINEFVAALDNALDFARASRDSAAESEATP